MKKWSHSGVQWLISLYPLSLICISRSALDSATQDYLTEHYKDGVASVFVPSTGKFTIQLVANKYNPQNFWSGRWRSKYDIDLQNQTVKGIVYLTVHYYEQGNVSIGSDYLLALADQLFFQVQLTTTFRPEITLPSSSPSPQAAKQLLMQIAEQEGQYQSTLHDTYHDLAEKRFKSLRRALPMTRNKIDWDKVSVAVHLL